jgi:hypothetical protein
MIKDMTPTEYMQQQGLRRLFHANSRHHNYARNEAHQSPEQRRNRAARTFLLQDGKILLPEVKRAAAESDEYFLSSVLLHAESIDLNLYTMPNWKESIVELAESLLSENTSSSDISNGYKWYAISAARMTDFFRWDTLFHRIWEAQRGSNYVRNSFVEILKYYADCFTSSFKVLAENEVFFSKTKPCYAARGAVYNQYIESGLLTLKTARKIRSDASSDSSVAGLRSLCRNKEKYFNYDDLLLQFTDSKYDEVIILLAEVLPDYLITSLMGTDSYQGRLRLERRLEQIDVEKEANKKIDLAAQQEIENA